MKRAATVVLLALLAVGLSGGWLGLPVVDAQGTCLPGVNGVVVYEHANYQGRCVTITADVANLSIFGFNDVASSIRFVGTFATGWEAQLFENANYSGTSSTFGASDPDFANDAIGHDRASSIRLRNLGAPPPSTGCPAGQYRAEYFNNRTLTGAATLSRCETAPINYDWGAGGPGGGVGVDNFSVRWSGRFRFEAGEYTFIGRTDDGMRVWLNNQLIIDAWRDQAPTEYRVTRTLTAGDYDVRVEYYEHAGGAVAQLRWERGSAAACVADAQLVSVSPGQTVVPGQRFEVVVELRNNGSCNWRQPETYLFNVNSTPLGASLRQEVGGVDILPGGTKRFVITMDAPGTPGVYKSQWQLRRGNTGFGPVVTFDVTVIDTGVAGGPTTCPADQYRAEYFNNRTLSGTPVLVRCEAAINYDWGLGGPGGGVGTDNFSVRWTRRIQLATGSYVFIARTDDGMRAWIDSAQIINAWRDQAPTEYRANVYALAGTYELRVEYYENGGGAVAQFRWEAR